MVGYLVDRSFTRKQLSKETDIANSGRLTEYLDDLETAGFITKDVSWQVKSKEEAKMAVYRLRDNYLRFYLKYIEPNLSRISSDRYSILKFI